MQEENRNKDSFRNQANCERYTEALHLNTALGRRKNKYTSSTLLGTLIVPHMQQQVVNVHVGKHLKDWQVAYKHQIQGKSDCQKN